MKTRLLFTYALVLLSLFLPQENLIAQQDCDYNYVLNCPARYQGCLDESSSSANTGFPTITRSGVLCDSVQFNYSDQIILQNDCNNLFDRLWSATIPGSNITTKCSQRIELFDNTQPIFRSCPPDVTLTLPDSTYSWTDPEVTDNCGTVNLSNSHLNGGSFSLGTTTVVITATDGCGNSSTCSFVITVEQGCTSEFNLICPQNYSGCVGDDIDPSVIGSANTTHMGDFCGTKSITYRDSTITNTACAVIINRIWTATESVTDETKTCIQVIELTDTEGPTVHTCPSDITNDDPNASVSWTLPTFSDNCSTVNTSSNYMPGTVFPIGETIVTYIATDQCGNTNTCSFKVTVTDPCDPDFTLTCPADVSGCRNLSTNTTDTGTATVSHSANFCGTVSVTHRDSTITDTSCELVIVRIWSATSSETGVTKTCNQRLSLIDNVAPTLINCPADVMVDQANTPVNWLDPQVSDNCGQVQLTSNYNSGSIFPDGETEVIYTATDQCGNVNTCSFIVNVVVDTCDQSFSIVCPSNYTGCIGDDIEPYDIGNANVTHTGDFCGGITITHSDSLMTNTAVLQIIHRTWTATTQEDGTVKSCVQIITLEDNQAPTIHNCPDDITLDFDNAQYTWTLPTASDLCSSVTLVSSHPSGTTFPVGMTTVTYTATDASGNETTCSFVVTVEDQQCQEEYTISCPSTYRGCRDESSDPSNTGMATATHTGTACGNLTITYRDSITNDVDKALIIERIWTATSSYDGSSKSCIQTIRLRDRTAPTIHNCPGDITLDLDDATYTWTLPTASDDCTTVTLESSHPNGSTFPEGETIVTYTATDDYGNSATCSFVIIVKGPDCDEDFTLVCPANYRACRDGDTHPSVTGRPSLNYSGSFCGSVSVTSVDRIISESDCRLVIERVWTGTSSQSGVVKTCVQTLRFRDNDAPIIENCPSNVVLEQSEATYSWTLPTASDNCSTVTLESTYPNGSTFPVGTTTVVYTATDECGNSSTCSFDVTVKQGNTGGSLVVICPDDIVLDCGEDMNLDKWPQPEVSSTCGSCDSDYSSQFVDMGSLDGHRYLCSRFNATWQDAADIARQMGGYLVIINSHEENTLLSQFLEVRSAFIGLSDHANEGSFKWVDGSPLSYSNWYPGQPNNYRNNQDYVELLQDGYWNDQYNYKKLEFIVEIPCIRVEQISGPASPSHFNGSATITYKVTDGCGNTKTCSFDVIKSGSLNLTCPQDIVVDLHSGHSTGSVSWDEPQVETCCTSGQTGASEIPGYVYMGSRGGHKYYCSKEDLTWHDAQRECQRYGGYLAVIDDAEENTMLANFLTVQSAYIGLSDHNSEGTFKWANGSSLGYNNWYPGQPNNYYNDQHYVEMLNNGQWNDQYTHKKREYIMEIPGGVEITQIDGPANGAHLSAGSYTIKYKATDACGNVDVCSFQITVNGSGSNDICNTGPTDSYGHWIESVQVGEFKNVTGNDDGYGDYTNKCAPVTKGKVVDIQLTSGARVPGQSIYWAIFIDWNKDGYYSESERIARGNSKSALKGRFLFAESLPTGNFPMRITANTHGYQSHGCEVVTHGEVEDYCLTVNDGTGYIVSKPDSKQLISMPLVEMVSFDLLDESVIPAADVQSVNINNISVFPNPFLNSVEIEGTEFIGINVWSISGKLIKKIEFKSAISNTEVDLTNLESGAYLLEINRNDGSSDMKKIIKR